MLLSPVIFSMILKKSEPDSGAVRKKRYIYIFLQLKFHAARTLVEKVKALTGERSKIRRTKGCLVAQKEK